MTEEKRLKVLAQIAIIGGSWRKLRRCLLEDEVLFEEVLECIGVEDADPTEDRKLARVAEEVEQVVVTMESGFDELLDELKEFITRARSGK